MTQSFTVPSTSWFSWAWLHIHILTARSSTVIKKSAMLRKVPNSTPLLWGNKNNKLANEEMRQFRIHHLRKWVSSTDLKVGILQRLAHENPLNAWRLKNVHHVDDPHKHLQLEHFRLQCLRLGRHSAPLSDLLKWMVNPPPFRGFHWLPVLSWFLHLWHLTCLDNTELLHA